MLLLLLVPQCSSSSSVVFSYSQKYCSDSCRLYGRMSMENFSGRESSPRSSKRKISLWRCEARALCSGLDVWNFGLETVALTLLWGRFESFFTTCLQSFGNQLRVLVDHEDSGLAGLREPQLAQADVVELRTFGRAHKFSPWGVGGCAPKHRAGSHRRQKAPAHQTLLPEHRWRQQGSACAARI